MDLGDPEPPPPEERGDYFADRGSVSDANVSQQIDKLWKKLEKTFMPELANLEERYDRLATECRELRKGQEADHSKMAEKADIEAITLRLVAFEKMDPKALFNRTEVLESDYKYAREMLDRTTEHVRRVESSCAMKIDVGKVKAEIDGTKKQLSKMNNEMKETSSSIYHANKQVSSMVKESRESLDAAVAKLQTEKVGSTDFGNVLDRLSKLEKSMGDNRAILNDAGGSEINAVVKRIILNMEDKIMMLEKKVDALAEGRAVESESHGIASAPSLDVSTATTRTTQELVKCASLSLACLLCANKALA